MTAWWMLAAVLWGDLPPVEVAPLAGPPVAGQLVELSGMRVLLRTAEGERELPLAGVLEIRFQATGAADDVGAARSPSATLVTLTDGSVVSGSLYKSLGATVRLEGSSLGPVEMPLSAVSAVQIGRGSAKAQSLWSELTAKESKKDILVIRKGEGADYLSGVIGEIDEKIKFVLDGDEVPVSRDKVFGLIYARRSPPRGRVLGNLLLAGGDSLQVAQLKVVPEGLEVQTAAGLKGVVPPRLLDSLNLSAGKLKYLSQLEWRQIKYVPWIDEDFPPLKDKSLGNRPLSIGGQVFPRGLWIHSRTTLVYRLGGEYRRLQAIMGIDDQGQGEVDVTIKGDAQVLYQGAVSARNPAIPLDLEIEGVKDLEILVDFGPKDYGPGDHLVLGDAKLLK